MLVYVGEIDKLSVGAIVLPMTDGEIDGDNVGMKVGNADGLLDPAVCIVGVGLNVIISTGDAEMLTVAGARDIEGAYVGILCLRLDIDIVGARLIVGLDEVMQLGLPEGRSVGCPEGCGVDGLSEGCING